MLETYVDTMKSGAGSLSFVCKEALIETVGGFGQKKKSHKVLLMTT